jgi:hypothetical protein
MRRRVLSKEQATRFQTILNLATAKALGLFHASLQSIAIQQAKALQMLLRAAKRELDPEDPGVLIASRMRCRLSGHVPACGGLC